MTTKHKRLEPIHPGEILLEDFMKPMGVSITRLADEKGTLPLTKRGRFPYLSSFLGRPRGRYCNTRPVSFSRWARG